jgi:hypothetical protein
LEAAHSTAKPCIVKLNNQISQNSCQFLPARYALAMTLSGSLPIKIEIMTVATTASWSLFPPTNI